MAAMDPPDKVADRKLRVPAQQESRWLIALVFVGITLRLLVLVISR